MKLADMKNNFYTLLQLSSRAMKMFLKDKASVFFSLLAPLIVLVLYVLFLGDLQVSSVESAIPEGISVDSKAIRAYIDSWMLVGVLSIACITVSFSANNIMIQDKERGVINDGLSAPVKKWVLTFGYFFSNFLITVTIVSVVFVICLIYIAASGEWYLGVGDVFGTFGVLLFSSLSATLISVFVCSFLKTESQHGGFVGIISAVIGFLIGAYMPMSVMPKAAQYVSGVIPGSHSAGLLRHFMMGGALENLGENLPAPVVSGIAESFEMSVNLLGKDVGVDIMSIYLAASILLFTGLNILLSFRKKAH